MPFSNPLRESLNAATLECWQRKRTVTPVRAFAVRRHAAGLSLRETEAIPHVLGVDRSYRAIFQWVHRLADSVFDPPSAKPRRVAVDEISVKIDGGWSWLYAAIDVETKILLDVQLFEHHGTNPAAAFLHGVTEKHDCSETVFLVDQYGYRTALSRLGLSDQIDHMDRNLHRKVVSHGEDASRPLP